ncbi:MAG: HlyC/CorC family transporter [Chloroflexi bacterium]|nr:HlyC/CorC family transporter [Chloroflexota bacterium]
MTGVEGIATGPLSVVPALVAVLVLIAINGLCVFNEFALVAMPPTRVAALEDGRTRLGRIVAKQVHDLDNYIAADQLGITITSIAAGWIGQPAVSQLLSGPIGALGLPEAISAALVAGILAFALITATQMIFGELVPKSISLRHAERVAHIIALPIEVMAFILRPLTVAMNGIGRFILRPFGIDAGMASHHQALGIEELSGAVSSSAAAGLLQVNPSTVHNAIRFRELTARDVMVPRPRVVGVHADDSLDEVLAAARAARHVRYPVFGDGDEVLGHLHLADLAGRLTQLQGPDAEAGWRELVRPLVAVPENASLESVLAQLRGSGQQMALVVDEFGSSEGVVNVSDLLRGLVSPPELPTTGPRPTVGLDAGTHLRSLDEDLAKALGAVDPQADTLNGVLAAALGRVPRAGDDLTIGGYRVQITKASDVRALEVDISRVDAAADRRALR